MTKDVAPYGIRITCDTKDALPWDQMDILQGALKIRTKEDYRKIKASIDEHGFADPFLVWREGEHNWIIDGTGRAELFSQLSAEGVELPPLLPVVYVHVRDMAEAKALLLKITSDFGKISSKGLQEFIKGLTIDFNDLGLNVFIPPNMPEGMGRVPPAPREAATQLGDCYEFCDTDGAVRHRLICGDAGQAASYAALMDGEQAALVFTDPPYGVSIGDHNRDLNQAKQRVFGDETGGSITDDLAFDDFEAEQLETFLARCFGLMAGAMADDAAYYVCSGSSYTGIAIARALRAAKIPVHQELIWVKGGTTMGLKRSDYAWQHEKIWYGWKKTHHFYGLGQYKTTVWNYAKPQKNKIHPTMKPVALVKNAIKDAEGTRIDKRENGVINNTGKHGIVLDPFAGSGTTLVACEHLSRRARLIELEPRYCDVIVARALLVNPALTVYRTRAGGRAALDPAEISAWIETTKGVL
jgi:DNA modification methylase